tara:strand:+ start:85 stop:513 length:429 start_codon:yes stop_codon:yes gene_type:complete
MSKVTGGKKQIRSLRGKVVDMDLLRKRNELTPAMGNARVNARGDELGPGGKILRKREEIVADHYAQAGTAAHAPAPENTVVEQDVAETEAVVKKTKRKVKVKDEPAIEVADLTTEEAEMMEEAAAEDEWVEDADGNFVQKGS